MKKNIVLVLMGIACFLGFAAIAFAQGPATIVKRGNRRYTKNDFDQALKLYNQAQSAAPDSAEIDFDIGTAQYKKGDYQSAVSSFEKASATKDRDLEAKALYNIGNSKYKMGLLKENTNLAETVALMRESLDYYKRSIDLNSKDRDPKINHELVEKQLKVLLDKLKEQEQNQKEQKGENKEEKEQNKQPQEQQNNQEQDKNKEQQKERAQEENAQEVKKEAP